MRHRASHAKLGVFTDRYHQGNALSPPAPEKWAHHGVSPGLWTSPGSNSSQRIGARHIHLFGLLLSPSAE